MGGSSAQASKARPHEGVRVAFQAVDGLVTVQGEVADLVGGPARIRSDGVAEGR